MDFGSSSRFIDNKIKNNTGDGYITFESSLTGNEAKGNTGNGFHLLGIVAALIKGNKDNGDDGFEVNVNDNTLTRNTSKDNGGFGIMDTSGGPNTYFEEQVFGQRLGRLKPGRLVLARRLSGMAHERGSRPSLFLS